MNEERTALEELLEEAKDFQHMLGLMTPEEKEKIKLFALGLMAASRASQQREATA